MYNLFKKKNNYDSPLIRKKAIMLMYTCHTIQPGSVPNIVEYAKEALCDRDPSVMCSSLYIFEELLKDFDSKIALKELVPSFVNILKQVIEHRLPRDYDYHRLPAPWIQIKILKILSILGRDDKAASEQMFETLREVMHRADTGLSIGHGMLYFWFGCFFFIYLESGKQLTTNNNFYS